MSKPRLNVGDDTPTGEQEKGPNDPDITDKSDDAVAKRE